MMKNFKTVVFIACAFAMMLFWTACHRRMAPMVSAGAFNEQRNETDYIVMPYGSVSLPGKWIHGRYRKESRQQYFTNFDSSTVTLAIGPCDKLGLPSHGASGYEFVKLYHQSETRYQTDVLHQTVKVVIADSANKYIIFEINGDNGKQFNLCGTKDCNCGQCAAQIYTIAAKRLTDEQQVKMLQDMYLDKK